jgi:hypothetical protein
MEIPNDGHDLPDDSDYSFENVHIAMKLHHSNHFFSLEILPHKTHVSLAVYFSEMPWTNLQDSRIEQKPRKSVLDADQNKLAEAKEQCLLQSILERTKVHLQY